MIYLTELRKMSGQCRLSDLYTSESPIPEATGGQDQDGEGQRSRANLLLICGNHRMIVSLQKSHGEEPMSAQPKMEGTGKIPPEINTRLRALAHDLSNSVETIMQASYLLAQSKLD